MYSRCLLRLKDLLESVTVKSLRLASTMADSSTKVDTKQIEVPEESSTKFSTVTEGKATIIQPASVFYNPVQEFNRDITIAFISEFAEEHVKEVREKNRKKLIQEKQKAGKTCNDLPDSDEPVHLEAGKHHPQGLRILEGLAASGLRSMRFGHEIPGVNKIICNDFDKHAVEIIQKNIESNQLGHLVEASHGDASMIMYQNKRFENRFDVVDLDPYGTAAPFFDAAVQAVRDGGLLCVTCTDAAVLCGNTPEKCFSMYGSIPVRGRFCHEQALRIILHSLESHAARHSRYIVPLVSLSVDFYFRIFVKVYTSQYKVKFTSSRTGMVYHCSGCGVYTTQPLCDQIPTKGGNFKFVPSKGPPVSEKCEHCGSRHQMCGPLYLGPLHDREYLERIMGRVGADGDKLGTAKRIEGMLAMAAEELDVPLYLEADGLYQVLHCEPPKLMNVRSAILNAGYKVSFSHACKNSLKTNAPNNVIWDIMRAHVENKPLNTKRNVAGTAGYNILQKKRVLDVNFEEHPEANPQSRTQGLMRWQPHPEKNWGPKPKAKRGYDGDTMEERRLRNQGKRKKNKGQDEGDGEDDNKQDAGD